MMSFKGVFLAVTAVLVKALYIQGTNESDLKWYCNTYCADSGGVPVFDRETLKCTCLLSKTVDTADIALVQKNAKAVDLAFQMVDPSDSPKPVFKRSISEMVAQRAPQTHRRRPPINRGQHSQALRISTIRPRHGPRNRQSQHSQPSLHLHNQQQQQHLQHDVHHQQQHHDLVHHQQQQHHNQQLHHQQLHHRPSLRQRMRHRNIVGSTQEKEPSSTQTPTTQKTTPNDDTKSETTPQIITQPTELM